MGMGVGVARTPSGQVLLHCDDDERGHHGDQAGHGAVAFVEDIGETGVRERDEGGREEVDERGGEEDAGAEVLAEEDDQALSAAALC